MFWTAPIVFIRPLGGGHLGRFHFLTIMNNAALNVHNSFLYGHVFSIVLGTYVGVEFEACGNSVFNIIWRK